MIVAFPALDAEEPVRWAAGNVAWGDVDDLLAAQFRAQPEAERDALLGVVSSPQELACFLLGELDFPAVVFVVVLHLHCRSFR